MTIDDTDVLSPEPVPLVHYTDHHGGVVCTDDERVPDDTLRTEVREKVTCPKCARIKPPRPSEVKSTWPDICPTCGAGWKLKSKTMGATHGQPHEGTCNNGHRWHETSSMAVVSGAIKNKLQEARQRRQADLTAMSRMVKLCNCLFPVTVYRNGHGHSEDCLFVLDKKARQ